jgi:hypothetical protein
MIADGLKARLASAPFKPFTLTLGSGQSFTVPHPEFASLSPGGRHLILWVGDDRYVDIDVLLIESIDSTSSNGRGVRRAG